MANTIFGGIYEINISGNYNFASYQLFHAIDFCYVTA